MDKIGYKYEYGKLLTENSQLKQKVLELTLKNAELQDELTELGITIKETPNDKLLGNRLRHDSWEKEKTNPNQLNLFEKY